jgi:hypothetical protein
LLCSRRVCKDAAGTQWNKSTAESEDDTVEL